MKSVKLRRYMRSSLPLRVAAFPLAAVVLLNLGCSNLRGADSREAEVIYGDLMCNCGGCNQTLGVCSMIGCSNAVPMREEVDKYVEEGEDRDGVLALFVEKYGVNILAAPPTAGWFNVSAWLTPFVALAVGLGLMAYFAWRFRRRWNARQPALSGNWNELHEQRLEDELADFTPED